MKWPFVVAIVLVAAPAFAREPQVGRWAADTNSCGGGDTQGTAPLTVTDVTLHWGAETCIIGKMYKADRALYIEGRCSNGGMMMRHPITLTMKGARLAVTWNGAHTELQRCP